MSGRPARPVTTTASPPAQVLDAMARGREFELEGGPDAVLLLHGLTGSTFEMHHLALDGGADGLEAYRALADQAPAHLAPGGLIALELGAGQAGAVTALFAARGFTVAELRADLGGVDRALLLERV